MLARSAGRAARSVQGGDARPSQNDPAESPAFPGAHLLDFFQNKIQVFVDTGQSSRQSPAVLELEHDAL